MSHENNQWSFVRIGFGMNIRIPLERGEGLIPPHRTEELRVLSYMLIIYLFACRRWVCTYGRVNRKQMKEKSIQLCGFASFPYPGKIDAAAKVGGFQLCGLLEIFFFVSKVSTSSTIIGFLQNFHRVEPQVWGNEFDSHSDPENFASVNLFRFSSASSIIMYATPIKFMHWLA